jgi:two-component system cell cycle sensor histidine kinase/response regulator CckA
MSSGTILLVEDEALVAKMMMSAFAMWGFRAHHAANPTEALLFAADHGRTISFLICDVMLPEMHGSEVAERIRDLCPGLKTCFTSGYPLDILSKLGALEPQDLNDSVMFLQKPFLPAVLRQVIVQGAVAPERAGQSFTERAYAAAS